MSDLIERQAVFDSLEKVADLFPYKVVGDADTYSKYNEAWNDAIGRAEMEIESLPSVTPKPRTGEWMKSYADHEAFGIRPFFRFCSECNEATVHPYNYCPNCGAKMNGGNTNAHNT